MPEEDSTDDATTAADPRLPEPTDDDARWPEELEELPRRPRRRLLAPLPVALFAVLLLAAGFFAGVRVEKDQSTASSSTAGTGGLAARFGSRSKGALPGSGSAAGAVPGSAPPGAAGGFPGFGGGTTGGLTTGQVAFVSAGTLYVTNTQGNTVKVTPTTGARITKTVTTKVPAISPGDTVTVQGSQGKSGSILATSVSVSPSGGTTTSGASAGGSGGVASLFGG